MEGFLLAALEEERLQHAIHLREHQKLIEAERGKLLEEITRLKGVNARQRELWTADTIVSDNTHYLYNTLIEDYGQNPAIGALVEDAEQTLSERPPSSRINRIMCAILLNERNMEHFKCVDLERRVLEVRNELAVAHTIIAERTKEIARLGPIDRILSENAIYQQNILEMGKRIADVEEKEKILLNELMVRSENVGNAVRAEYEQRRQAAHAQINRLHVDLLTMLCQVFHSKTSSLEERAYFHEQLVKHLEAVRLVLFRT
jgi:hypothetical protein